MSEPASNVCGTCTFINDVGASHCQMCGNSLKSVNLIAMGLWVVYSPDVVIVVSASL